VARGEIIACGGREGSAGRGNGVWKGGGEKGEIQGGKRHHNDGGVGERIIFIRKLSRGRKRFLYGMSGTLCLRPKAQINGEVSGIAFRGKKGE